MDNMIYQVFARLDTSGRVMTIDSSAFLTDTDGWTLIDEGAGDRYHHAQGNYLDKPLTDERGVYRYSLIDGAVVERTSDDMGADYTQPQVKPSIESRMLTVEGETAELREALDLLLSGVVE